MGSTVLGSKLFTLYSDDLDYGISSDISRFTYDTKTGRLIRSDNDVRVLQGEIDRLYKWSNFNTD